MSDIAALRGKDFVSCRRAPWWKVAPPAKADGARRSCVQQAVAAAQFINATLGPRLSRLGLRARDCRAVGVELRPVWGEHLAVLAHELPRRFGAPPPAFHEPYAASHCDGARVDVFQCGRYDHFVKPPPGLDACSGFRQRPTNATTLNTLRLISEAARPQDVVVVKMDIVHNRFKPTDLQPSAPAHRHSALRAEPHLPCAHHIAPQRCSTSVAHLQCTRSPPIQRARGPAASCRRNTRSRCFPALHAMHRSPRSSICCTSRSTRTPTGSKRRTHGFERMVWWLRRAGRSVAVAGSGSTSNSGNCGITAE